MLNTYTARVIKLLRGWLAARRLGEASLSAMCRIYGPQGLDPMTVTASLSLFELIEGHLERPLVGGLCTSPDLSPDERGVLAVLYYGPKLSRSGATSDIPHGLSRAICWAASAVLQYLGIDDDDVVCHEPAATQRLCPFSTVARPALRPEWIYDIDSDIGPLGPHRYAA